MLAADIKTWHARVFVAYCYDYTGGGWYDTAKRTARKPVLRYRWGKH